MLLQESNTLLRSASNCRNGKNGSDAASNQIGIVEVGKRVANHNGIDMGGIRSTQYGSKVSWFLHLFEHDHQRRFA